MKFVLMPLAALIALGSCTAIPPEEAARQTVPPLAGSEAATEAAAERVADVADMAEEAIAPPPRQINDDRPAPGALPEIERGELKQGGWLIGIVPDDVTRIDYEGSDVTLAEDGRFFIGFDRDAPLEATLSVRYADGLDLPMPLTLSKGDWSLQHINAPYRGSARSNAEFQRRRQGEIDQIVAARAKSTDADGWRQHFIWPVRGRISGVFGSQRVYQGKPGPYHGGLDIAVPTGTPFVAPADGVVILAAQSPFTLEGYLLMIDHGEGLNSAFLHCSELLVEEGDTVRQGQPIGKVGATGRATGPHLHWGLKWKNARIDPMSLLE